MTIRQHKRPNLHRNDINCILTLNQTIFVYRNAFIFVFLLLPCHQSGQLKSFSAPPSAPAGGGDFVRLLWEEYTQMSTFSPWLSPCPLISRENCRLLFPRWIFLRRNKSSNCMHWGKQIPTDKAKPVVLWPCWPDFICRVGLALCHSALSKEAELGSLIWRPPSAGVIVSSSSL